MPQLSCSQTNFHARCATIVILICQLVLPGLAAQFKYSGLISRDNSAHQITKLRRSDKFEGPSIVGPTQVKVTITNPGPANDILVPQYGPSVNGTASSYDPAQDCDGNFMPYKFQPNNNCYNYGCDIATNTFAQPGRMAGNHITAETLNGPSIQQFAEQDGLINVGTSMADVKAFAANRTASKGMSGHFVSLMISLAHGNWTGDFHWVRCDDAVNFASWSQKDGVDAVTNFDHAGYLITDPSKANWAANLGPQDDGTDMIVVYDFFTFMFVPHGAAGAEETPKAC